MKVGIFTPYPLDPIHPRTEMYLSFFHRKGIDVTIEHSVKKPGILISWLSKVFINMFDFQAVFSLAKEINKYDVVLIQDLKYLPLAVLSKVKKRRTVYETLDNSVYIRVHSQKEKFFYPVIKLLTPLYCLMEKCFARFFTDSIVVNSEALGKHFHHKSELIFYASPFESAGILNNFMNPPALLYLGAISPDKGIHEILTLINHYKIPAYLFGDCPDDLVRNAIGSDPLITWKKRMNSGSLKQELELLTQNFFLIGLSLIRPVHYSYATQEANKEIDYMTMGIPFIGNHRKTTQEKITAGCGVFLDDADAIAALLNDPENRRVKAGNCQDYYNRHYSVRLFEAKVASIFKLA